MAERESEAAGWYLRRPDQPLRGPLTTAQIVADIKLGSVRPDAIVCPAGGNTFRAVAEIPPFAEALRASPHAALMDAHARLTPTFKPPPGEDPFLKETVRPHSPSGHPSHANAAFQPVVKTEPLPADLLETREAAVPLIHEVSTVDHIASGPTAGPTPPPPGPALHPHLSNELSEGDPLRRIPPKSAPPAAKRRRGAAFALWGLLAVSGGLAAWALTQPVSSERPRPNATEDEEASELEREAESAGAGTSEAVEENGPSDVQAASSGDVDDAGAAEPSDAAAPAACVETPLPPSLCTWLDEVAGGDAPSAAPRFADLQRFFLEHDVVRVRGLILVEDGTAKRMKAPANTVQVTSSGSYGYCLRPLQDVEPGAGYRTWVIRHAKPQPAVDMGGAATECILYEEVALPQTLSALKESTDPQEQQRLATEALGQVDAFFAAR